jgi:ubiquitin-protein ligase
MRPFIMYPNLYNKQYIINNIKQMFHPFEMSRCEELIEKIPKKCIKSRIKAELKSLVKDETFFLSTNLQKTEVVKPIIQIKDKLYKTNNVYTFEIHDTYPFQAPNTKINGHPYATFLRMTNVHNLNRLHKNAHIDCLCCNSIVGCISLWKPSFKIETIVQEIRRYRAFRKRILYNLFSEKIKERFRLPVEIDLDGWLYSFQK